MPKLSIIIPVYNTEKYLAECLESVSRQTFSDWEMIIIEDCSTDNSRRIVAAGAAKNQKIKAVFHAANQGVSASRNEGLNLAQGEFITFVDSDDWLEPEMYEQMLKRQAETDADIVECNFTHRQEKGRDYRELNNIPALSFPGAEVNAYLLNIYQYHLAAALYNKIYRRSILKTSGLGFADHKKVQMEDRLFLLLLAPYLRRLAGVPESYYNYRHRVGSISRHKISDLLERIIALIDYYQQAVSKDQGVDLPPAFALIITTQVRYALFYAIIQETHPLPAGRNILRQAARDPRLKKFISDALVNRHTSLPDRIFALLFNLKLYRLVSRLYLIFLVIKNRTNKIYQVETA